MKKKFFSALLSLCLTLSVTLVPASALELEDAKKLLQQYYVDTIPDSVLNQESLDALLAALGDPYTTYLTAEEYQGFLDAVNGQSVVGIGVSIHNVFDGGFQILSVLPDSPALEAGLEAGDTIAAVNGAELTDGMDVRALIAGEEGTDVTITVVRRADGQRRDYTLTRRSVTIPIVTYTTDGTAGIIDCTSFGGSTVSTVEEALRALNDDVAVWIMDLRSNPGGTSNAAAGSAGLFVGSRIMVYFRDGEGTYNYVYTLPSCPDLTDKPLIVMTSPYSASGSELFAAAARDHGFGIAVGQRTFGKGIAQIVLDKTNAGEYFDGDAMKITAYRFFSPDGATNHIVGVLPTLMISQENTAAAVRLLSSAEPKAGQRRDFLRLDLYGFSFYIDLKDAGTEENRAAFTELLEALPARFSALRTGSYSGWSAPVAPETVAKQQALPFHSRGGFSDLTGCGFADELETLAAYGMVSGYEDGSFRPDAAITRAEFCAMVSAALDLPAGGKAPAFSDVAADAWYADAVAAMAARGFVSGCGDGTFRPDSTVTYEEMVTILSSAAAWCTMDGYDLAKKLVPVGDWLDYYSFSDWAQSPAWRLTQLGMDLELEQPQAPGSRAVSAHLLYSFLEASGLFWGRPVAE